MYINIWLHIAGGDGIGGSYVNRRSTGASPIIPGDVSCLWAPVPRIACRAPGILKATGSKKKERND